MSRTLDVHIRVTDETGRPTPVRIRIGGPDGSGAVNAFLMRSIDTGSVASVFSGVEAVDAVDVVDAGCVVCAVCPAYATTDEHNTLIVNSDSR